jgi:hypothetical protein
MNSSSSRTVASTSSITATLTPTVLATSSLAVATSAQVSLSEAVGKLLQNSAQIGVGVTVVSLIILYYSYVAVKYILSLRMKSAEKAQVFALSRERQLNSVVALELAQAAAARDGRDPFEMEEAYREARTSGALSDAAIERFDLHGRNFAKDGSDALTGGAVAAAPRWSLLKWMGGGARKGNRSDSGRMSSGSARSSLSGVESASSSINGSTSSLRPFYPFSGVVSSTRSSPGGGSSRSSPEKMDNNSGGIGFGPSVSGDRGISGGSSSSGSAIGRGGLRSAESSSTVKAPNPLRMVDAAAQQRFTPPSRQGSLRNVSFRLQAGDEPSPMPNSPHHRQAQQPPASGRLSPPNASSFTPLPAGSSRRPTRWR